MKKKIIVALSAMLMLVGAANAVEMTKQEEMGASMANEKVLEKDNMAKDGMKKSQEMHKKEMMQKHHEMKKRHEMKKEKCKGEKEMKKDDMGMKDEMKKGM